MEILGTGSDTTFQESVDEPPIEVGNIYEILKCPACEKETIRKYFWHDYMDDSMEPKYEILYPQDARIPIGLPDNIVRAYLAALKVKSVDSNAFGVLIGRVIEMVCVDRGASGRMLGQKLQDLATKGEIPDKLVEVAGKLAKLRNIGAHSDLGELTEKEAPIVEDLCKSLLDYLYTAPHLANKAEEAINELLNQAEN